MLPQQLSWDVNVLSAVDQLVGPAMSRAHLAQGDLAIVRAVQHQNHGQVVDLLDIGASPNAKDLLTDHSLLQIAVEVSTALGVMS